MTAATTYRAAGTTDDVTTCDVCGRDDLKSTMVLAVVDVDNNRVDTTYAGSWCGAQLAGRTVRDLELEARDADRAAARARDADRRAAARTVDAEWATFAADRFPDAAGPSMIAIRRSGVTLEDYRAARAAFAAA